MVITRIISAIMGVITVSLGTYTVIEIYSACEIILKVGKAVFDISGPIGGIVLYVPILVVIGILFRGAISVYKSRRKVDRWAMYVKEEAAKRGPVSEGELAGKILGIGLMGLVTTLYTSFSPTLSYIGGNEALRLRSGVLSIMPRGWREISMETKLEWLSSCKLALNVEERYWEKIEKVIDWGAIESIEKLMEVIKRQMIAIMEIEKNRPTMIGGIWNNVMTGISEHPYVSIGIAVMVGVVVYWYITPIITYISAMGEKVVETLETQKELGGQIVACEEMQKELARIVKEIASSTATKTDYIEILVRLESMSKTIEGLIRTDKKIIPEMEEIKEIITKILSAYEKDA